MKTTVSQTSSTERRLEIEIPRERFDKIFQEKVKKYSKEMRINGFRPGNVPKDVILARFKDPISAESLESLIDQAVRESCKENNIDPVAPGRIEKLDNEAGQPIKVKALLEVDPPVELKDYRFEIPVTPQPVMESAVEERVQGIRRQLAAEKPAGRPAQIGDVVMAKYLRIQIGGQNEPLPQHPVFRVEIGKGSIPELDKALVGVKSGDVKDVAFSFPAEYPNPGLAGKASAYTLAIEDVLEVNLPQLDDAFCVNLGYENLAAMRSRIQARLEEGALRQAKETAWDEAIRRLLEGHAALGVPKARIQNYVKHRLEEMGHHHPEGEDHGHDHSDLEREAEMQIRRWRLLDAIAQKESIKPSQEDVDARIRGLAERTGNSFEALKAELRKNGKILDMREEAKAEKTLDFVIGWPAK